MTAALEEKQAVRLRFERREWKYLIPKQMVDGLAIELTRYMNIDAYSASGPYEVYSVYFETADWNAFHEKLDGVQYRKKFRIRSYNGNPKPDDLVLMEVKEKRNDIIVKRRTQIELGQLPDLVRGRLVGDGGEVAQEWRYHVLRQGLRPARLIHYNRVAFEPRGVGEHRVTIDRDIQFASIFDARLFTLPTRQAALSKLSAVLEIKFAAQLPSFLVDLVHTHSLSNEAISKYCDSVITGYKLK